MNPDLAPACLAAAGREAGLPPGAAEALAERYRQLILIEPVTLTAARAGLDALRRGCRQLRRWARLPAATAVVGGVWREWPEVAAEAVAAAGRLDALAADAAARVEAAAAGFRRGGRRDLAELVLGAPAKVLLAHAAAAALEAARPGARGNAGRLYRLVATVHSITTGDDRETGVAHAVRAARRSLRQLTSEQ